MQSVSKRTRINQIGIRDKNYYEYFSCVPHKFLSNILIIRDKKNNSRSTHHESFVCLFPCILRILRAPIATNNFVRPQCSLSRSAL